MPTYEYACKECDYHFDVRHGADEKPALSCPRCENEVRKVFHAAGIIFKGSGWYITDSAPKKGDNGAEKKEDAPEAKPETKTPTPATAPVPAESKA